jgi:hypothetical protein
MQGTRGMVWGMIHPPGSNGFYLSGEFEGPSRLSQDGWRERMERHYRDELPAGEQAVFQDENNNGAHWYAGHVVNKFSIRRDLVGRRYEGADDGIADHEVPQFYRSSGNVAKLASLATFSGPVLTVDDSLRAIIEWVEPGVHTFVPIPIKRGRDTPVLATRHILIVEQWIDSFSEVHSDSEAFAISPDRKQVKHSEIPRKMRKLAFRSDRIGKAHLWFEPRLVRFLLCMSDRLQAEIADAGLRIPRCYPLSQV